jgi:hypothetical protein
LSEAIPTWLDAQLAPHLVSGALVSGSSVGPCAPAGIAPAPPEVGHKDRAHDPADALADHEPAFLTVLSEWANNEPATYSLADVEHLRHQSPLGRGTNIQACLGSISQSSGTGSGLIAGSCQSLRRSIVGRHDRDRRVRPQCADR